MIEKHEHYGNAVWFQSHLKGKHREHSLCFQGCLNFQPGPVGQCKIVVAVNENSLRFGISTPIYACPKFATLNPSEIKDGSEVE